jgi:hypothetical protein
LFVPPRQRSTTRSVRPSQATEPSPDVRSAKIDGASVELPQSAPAIPIPQVRRPDVTAGIDIRWTDDGACIVELRGRPTRPMLSKARDLLWSRSPQDRLTIVVSDAVLTRELFAMLIAGRRRLRASGVLEIVGLDAIGARRIADSRRTPDR